jgi:hypothetical protein
MNQKVLVAIAITALILGILNLILLLAPPQSNPLNLAQKIPLEGSNTVIKLTENYYAVRVTISLPIEVQTLFDCYVQAEYLTENGLLKTTTEKIGIVNYDEYVPPDLYLNLDFAYEDAPLEPSIAWGSYDGNNISVTWRPHHDLVSQLVCACKTPLFETSRR